MAIGLPLALTLALATAVLGAPAALVALAAPAAPAAAVAPASSLPSPSQASEPAWSGHPVIVAAPAAGGRPGRVWLETAPGERALVPVPPRARIVAAEALASGWVAAGTEPSQEGTEILLLAGTGGEVAELPPPPRQGGALRREPLPLVESGRLAGLVWLEGATLRSLAVRYASWDGSGWRDEELISPPGAGSQLALTAARLADGSWLLAWSAFDGTADQIVWSARRGRTWTRPQPLAPQRAGAPYGSPAPHGPNITPDLAPLPASEGGGALIAWSRLEGAGDGAAYRVVMARYAGGRWQEPEPVGPLGSLYPTFVATPAAATAASTAPTPGLRMLYRTAEPAGWTLLDLGATGRLRRAAFLASAAPLERGRPVPAEGSGGVLFRWPAAGGEHFVPWIPWEPVR